MSGLVYLLVEGVHDVAFVGKLLTACFGAVRVKTMEELDEATRRWMSSFKWPIPQGGKTPIERLAVPAPVLQQMGSNRWFHFGSTTTFNGRIDFPYHEQTLGFQSAVLAQLSLLEQ